MCLGFPGFLGSRKPLSSFILTRILFSKLCRACNQSFASGSMFNLKTLPANPSIQSSPVLLQVGTLIKLQYIFQEILLSLRHLICFVLPSNHSALFVYVALFDYLADHAQEIWSIFRSLLSTILRTKIDFVLRRNQFLVTAQYISLVNYCI